MTGAAFIILGIVFLCIALYTFVIKLPKSRVQISRRTGKTRGKISNVDVKILKHKKKSGLGYHETKTYRLDVTYNVGGTDYELKKIISMTSKEVGEEVDVSYNPDEPSDAHADEFFAGEVGTKAGGVVMLIIAVVLLLIGCAIVAL
ncbi:MULTISPECIES: DUF3592 domain-containing protein [unclassified Butyrivibrio]|jgi:hypothetical protein|uniref:DUF3592 domain-containing protein n=1 Tax=unclassified Butyrivibrio TaxID=2639466 RepID=UPI0003F98383|nr:MULTISPECIES: DUF3592 domain-containing protein [unclassified Butyrivibrio]